MLPGFSGSLVSEYFAESLLQEQFGGELGVSGRDAARTLFQRWARGDGRRMGPVTLARGVHDLAAVPMMRALGFDPVILAAVADGGVVVCRLVRGTAGPLLVVAPWAGPLDAAWTAAARHVIAGGADWCFATNGRELRLLDVRRALARGFVQFDVEAAVADDASFGVFWGLLRREGFEATPLIERVALASSRHTVGVCRSLRSGVLDAVEQLLAGFAGRTGLGPDDQPSRLDQLHEQALTIVYRILFLLFAESRGLVPLWHPVYRESYSIEALRDLAERPGRPRGLWEALQAISRLAHSGCRAGALRVTPFNGRLFAPSLTPIAEEGRLGDDAARRVLLALSTTTPGPGRGIARVAYRDLGVEQLGAVYESVLDYRPQPIGDHERRGRPQRRADVAAPGRGGTIVGLRLAPCRGVRKATGTFYTPRSITTYLVRQTLAPLVEGRSPGQILSLRVVDPSMGSGAFLVEACRYLAAAYELSVTREAGYHPSDISDVDRRLFRRLVAQHCLFGVDRNPMAVQLARLSLWLCTLAPERPLTFLDHHLMTGDSLVGASLDDLRRPPPGATRRRGQGGAGETLPLFDLEDVGPALRVAIDARWRLASVPDDSLAAVQEKERLLAGVACPSSPMAGWKAVADLWCGFAFRGGDAGANARLFPALADAIVSGRSPLPAAVVRRSLGESTEIAAARRFFHWTLEFPEAFYAPDGAPCVNPGFDAVIGNPPWDMVRDDNLDVLHRQASRADAVGLLRFVRSSGVYRAQGDGHTNLYQLFVERALRLVRTGGRIGLVVPWGFASDQGCAGLRRLLFDRSRVDSWVGFENTAAIFPIHRSVRFMLVTTTAGGRTDSLSCRLGEKSPEALDWPAGTAGERGHGSAVVFSRRLLERLSPEDLAVPDARTEADVALLEKVTATVPHLGSARGWGAEFGRELNASDDRRHFVDGGEGLPVVEGKHVEPFHVRVPADVRRLPAATARKLLDVDRTCGRSRVGYRDVASATNRLTLIAAVVPAGCVTVHTLFCLKTLLGPRDQDFLCGVLNSFVANYLVRLRVTTHVTTRIVSRLPVPRPPSLSAEFETIARLSRRLRQSPGPLDSSAYAALQAAVGHLYGLTAEEFRHILGTFPLVEEETRTSARERFESGNPGIATSWRP